MIRQSTMPLPAETDSSLPVVNEEFRECLRTALRRLPGPAAGGRRARPAEAVPPVRTLGITSCSRREGVTTVAAEWAAVAAGMDEGEVLLVDANMAHPAVHELFDVDFSPGLSELLLNPSAWPAWVQPSGYENLVLLTAGEPNSRLPKTFDTAGISSVLGAVEREYNLVVFDLPPAGEQSAALRLAGLLDAVVLVVEAERVRYDIARRVKQLLERAGASVCGVVLNKRRDYVPWWLRRDI